MLLTRLARLPFRIGSLASLSRTTLYVYRGTADCHRQASKSAVEPLSGASDICTSCRINAVAAPLKSQFPL